MSDIVQQLMSLRELDTLRGALGQRPMLTGLSPVHRAMVAAVLHRSTDRPMLLLCSDEKESRRLQSDLEVLTGETVAYLPHRLFRLRRGAVSREWAHRRMETLYGLATGQTALVVADIEAAVQRSIPPAVLLQSVITLRLGERHDLAALTHRLIAAGYSRCEQVEGPGQFALRGGILDVFSPSEAQPVRCEFWDDEIDAMGHFDTATQRRTHNIEIARLLPAEEVLPFHSDDSAARAAAALEEAARRLRSKHPAAAATLDEDADMLRRGVMPAGSDRYAAAVYEGMHTVFDYLPDDAVICLCESGRISEALRGILWQTKQDVTAAAESGDMAAALGELTLGQSDVTEALSHRDTVQLCSLTTGQTPLPPKTMLHLPAKLLSTYGGSLETAAADIRQYRDAGYAVAVLCSGEVRCRNMQRLLEEKGIDATVSTTRCALPPEGGVTVSCGALSAGSEWPQLRLAVLTEGQLTRAVSGKQQTRRVKSRDNQQKLRSFTDLTPGDLVVHAHHGIGRFVEMLRMPAGGVEKDYIKIAYAGTDCLYVPATALDLVSKYIGSGEEEGGKPTRLNKLGGTEWARTTHRARAAAKDLAEGLIKLYAARQRLDGFAFSPDSPWQQEFEEAFEYEETADQRRAIAEIKADMEKTTPMDRLLCGDVGYGKTEVALRAVMKCILDGKQAAILVPTTVLAQQHYATARSRFHTFPVTIEVLSRFRSPKQVQEVLKRVQEGKVDLLIGTHKLLGKQVQFKDLGLLIIDEEQRFGVTHKEKLRERTKQVDTLTLSATPIPRTLNMALSGIRDMSTIEEPPRDRQPVQTYVLEHDWSVVVEAIRRELGRGGQVYYLHNRVESIDSTALRLKQMLGEEVTVAIAHGKMSESQLSGVMQDMADGEIQVLVCTTIIETGIDIPNVNTLIVEDAERMGLSQLHQLRGRIGRSSRRAAAYLTYRGGKVLTEVAAKRLTAIREYVEFGSGFKIAMRDLEIRGAGNLLGPEQSGYMMSVGYDMYLKLLNEAVLEQQGKRAAIAAECTADITVSAYIPESYVPAPAQRMDLYRRIAAIRSDDDAADLYDELLDRYGEVPQSVKNLVDVALLRAAAAAVGVRDITQRREGIVLTFTDAPDVAAVAAVCAMGAYRRRLRLTASAQPKLTLQPASGEEPLAAAAGLIESLAAAHRETIGDTNSPNKEEQI